MSDAGKNSCSCGCSASKPSDKRAAAEKELTLADLPVGATGVIVKIMPGMRGRKKFADVGLVAGAKLLMEAHAPFGSLLRVRVLETSMALHRDDAAKIIMKPEGH